MKKFVLPIFAALLTGCSTGPVVVVSTPVPTIVIQSARSCLYGGVWQYNAKTQVGDCVIYGTLPTTVTIKDCSIGATPAYNERTGRVDCVVLAGSPMWGYHPHPRVGWGVIVIIHSGGYR